VRFALPQDEFMGFVESDAAVRGECEEVGFLHRMERRVLFEKVGDAVTDGRRIHGTPAQHTWSPRRGAIDGPSLWVRFEELS
jgi:hypothetical protein